MVTAGLIHILDIIGTVVFALSGAVVGVRRRMDLFGILVLATVTAVVGGIIRDVVIGAIPPASVKDWHNPANAVAAGLVAFFWHPWIDKLRSPVLLFDALGLGIFAVTGAQKALEYAITPASAAVLGMITGIGGGMVRDVLTAEVPSVLREDLYAVAALAGALVVVVGNALGAPVALTLLPGVALCFFLRLMAIYRGWRMPFTRGADDRSRP